MKQFLLRPDGSFPPNTDVEALQKAGVLLVLSTPRPRPGVGQMIVEAEPEQVNGIWRQRWIEVPAPPPSAEEPTE